MRNSNWKNLKLKYLVDLAGDRADSRPEDYRYIGLENIRSKMGELSNSQENVDEESLDGTSTVNLFRAGDILFGKLRPYLAKAWVCEFDGACTTEALVFRPKPGILPRFLLRAILSEQFIRKVDETTFGSKMPRADWQSIGNIEIGCPSTSEQAVISQFLDIQTKRLDALVAEKQKLLGTLSEKRRALITHAVTQGLDPKAQMRDSGIPWLGKIPANWEVRRARYLFTQSNLPVRENDQMVTCFRDGEVTLRSNRREEGFTNGVLELGYQGIREGQLILHSMDAFAGAIGVSDSDGKCSPEYIICDPLDDSIAPHYYALLLREMALRGFIQASCPAVRERAPRIRFNDFKDFFLPIQSHEAQVEILSHIRRSVGPIDDLMASTRRAIGILQERRSALISAAVTGQMEIGDLKCE